MKRLIAMTLSTSLLFNSAQMAFAATDARADQSLSESEIQEMLGITNTKVVEALKKSLVEVTSLMGKLRTMSDQKESNPWIRALDYGDLILAATSAYTLQAQMKKADSARILMSVNVASLLLKKISQYLKEGHKLDGKVIGQKIFETSNEISNIEGMPEDIKRVKMELNELTIKLQENKGMIDNAAAQMGVGDNIALVIGVVYLAIHLVYPKSAKQADAVLTAVLPKLQESILKATQVGKGKVLTGASAATVGLPDIVRFAAGITSEQSQDIVNRTLVNLDTTATNIRAEIARHTK